MTVPPYSICAFLTYGADAGNLRNIIYIRLGFLLRMCYIKQREEDWVAKVLFLFLI